MYDNIVLKTRPTHYFPLSSSTSYDLLHNYNNRVYDDIQVIGTPWSASTLVPKTGYTFPIITNSGSAAASLKIKKGDLHNFTAQYKRGDSGWLGAAYVAYNFEINNYNKDFSISFWFNFNNQINGQSKISDTNQILIYNVIQKNGNATPNKSLLEIYFDYPTSTFRLKFPDSDSKNTEAYCYVDKIDQSFQITATYTRGQIILKVNDQVGSGFVTKNSYIFYSNPIPYYNGDDMLQIPPANLIFNITGTSLGDSSNPEYVQNYLVSSLAYYQRILSDADLDTLASFAYQDGFPISQSMLGDNSYFDLREIGNFDEFTSNGYTSIVSGLTNKYGDYEKIYGSGFKVGDIDNLNSSRIGLTPILYHKPYYYKRQDTNTASYTVNSSSGINFIGDGYMQFDDIEYFDFSSKASITCVINGIDLMNPGGIRNNIYLLQTGDKYLMLSLQTPVGLSSNHTYLLEECDRLNPEQRTSILSNTFVRGSATTDKIGLSFSNNSILFYSSLGGTSSVSISKPYSAGIPDSFIVGQETVTGRMYNNKIYIKNIGIINKYISNYSSFDFENPSTIMFRMTSSANPFLVSQLGTWTYTIPTAVYPTCTVTGTQFNWNLDNCKVSVSSDNGVTYNKILPYQTITSLNLNSVLNNIKVKMELQTEYDYDSSVSTKFSQFEYLIYTNQNIYSNGKSIYFSNNDTKKANYTLSSQNNVMSRHKNFGIKFTGDSNKSPGSASIVNEASTAFQTIDFWYRPDGINTAYRTNLITNPSFESGTTAWNSNQGSSISLNTSSGLFGSNCLEVTQSSTIYSGTVTDNIAVNPSTTYTFSYYVKTGSATASINLGGVVFFRDSSLTIKEPWIITSNVNYTNSQGWVRASRTFTTDSDTRYIQLFICPTGNGVSGQKFLIDGAMLEQSSSVSTYFDGTYTGNLITNQSFESGSSGWTNNTSNVSVSIQTSSAYSLFGANSLNISIGSSSTSPTCYSFAQTNIGSGSGIYTFSAYVYSPTSTNIRIIFRDNNGSSYNQGSIYTIPAATWTRVSRTVSQEYASAKWDIGFEVGQVVLNSNLYIDGVMVELSSSINDYIDSSMISWNGTANLSSSRLGNSYIVGNTSSSLPSPSIWLNASSRFQSLGGSLYINSASVADNTYTASANELYHIVLALSASNNSSLYLNGTNSIIPSVSSSATYGHVTLWTDKLTSDQILKRYQSYYYGTTASVTDDGTKKYFSNTSTDSFKVFRLNN